jgi:hypothetical protein
MSRLRKFHQRGAALFARPEARAALTVFLVIDFLMVACSAIGFAHGHYMRAAICLGLAVVSLLTGVVSLSLSRPADEKDGGQR